MKTVHFLLAGTFLLAVSLTATAQETSSKIGIKGGLNYSTVTQGKFEEGPDPRTGFHLGLVGEIPLLPKFALQPELVYSRQGFEYDNLVGDRMQYKLDYLNVPVLAKIYLFKGLSIEAGPQFGFKISEKVDYKGENTEPAEEDNYNNFDTALAGGVSFNFPGGFFITGRYTQSLNEVIKDSDAKNKVFQAGVGFKF